MTPEQLKWGDKQWAKYLECSVAEFQQAREFIQRKYAVDVFNKNKRYYVALYMCYIKRSRSDRGVIKESKQLFDNLNDAVQYANEKFIPSLAFDDIIAEIYDVPAKILQTLHIKQK